MVLRSKVSKVLLASSVGLFMSVGLQVESEATGYEDLCYSFPSACEYAPSTAPVLASNVCFNAASIELMVGSSCPPNSYPYYVKYGEVINPMYGTVQPYIRIADACDMGYCVPHDPNDPPGEEGAMCCDIQSGGCSETDGICPPDKIAVWCEDGETGVLQNGEWVCEETE